MQVSFLAATTQAGYERSAQLSALALLNYEYVITFGSEVEYFWKRRWSIGKVMFLWSRYYSLCYNTGNVFVFLHTHPTEDFCGKFFHWQNAGATLQVITTHLILMLRLYAMYESSRVILALFMVMILAEIGCIAYIVGVQVPGEIGTNEPYKDVFICADGDPENGHIISYYYTTILIAEVILMCLAMYKAWVAHKSGPDKGGKMMKMLTRDSVKYFIAIFLVYSANQGIWIVNVYTLNEVLTGFGFVVSAIMANRLMINVRENYYLLADDTHPQPSRKRKSANVSTGIVGLSQLPGWTPYQGLGGDQRRMTSVPFEFQDAEGRPQSQAQIRTQTQTQDMTDEERQEMWLNVGNVSLHGMENTGSASPRRSVALSVISGDYGRRRSAIENDFELRTFSESRGF